MLSDFTGADKVYIACGYTDLRRGIDGLAAIVQQEFQLDPFTNTLFLFCGRRRDRIKALYSKFYKNKKRVPNDRENWVIFKDVHEPVIDRVIWEQVQEKRGKIRRRKAKDGERNMFCGLLVCADCGHNLNFLFNQGNHDIKYFNCSNYNSSRGTCTSTHYIRVDFLEQVVLGEIKRLTKYAVHYEDEFQQVIMGSTQKTVELERKLK